MHLLSIYEEDAYEASKHLFDQKHRIEFDASFKILRLLVLKSSKEGLTILKK